MRNYLYWAVFKNLENEVLELANSIHFDDDQLSVYSVKIADLLVRTVIEVEALSKELYFLNGGNKSDDNNLFFDTDCLELLENKWKLSSKVVVISSPYFYFSKDENRILTPLKKANKRGTSSAKWLRAYQAVKHNRVRELEKGNLKSLIHAMAGLYILNIYYKDETFDLGVGMQIQFDASLGSSIFSVLTQQEEISISKENELNDEKCVYFFKVKSMELKESAKNLLHEINSQISTNVNNGVERGELKSYIYDHFPQCENADSEIEDCIRKLGKDYRDAIQEKVINEHALSLASILRKVEYEAILNKQA